jgi:DNA primase
MDVTANVSKSIPQLWEEYIIDSRKLSRDVVQDAGLFIKSGNLAIPVFDADRKQIFCKYRTPPWESGGAKYLYDKGASLSLYGIEGLKDADMVVITEGELDALSVRTAGVYAVSSTGGAMAFREEWAPLFDGKKVYIMFDNDRAGMTGAFHVATLIPHAKVAWIPHPYGKDANDVLRQPTGQNFIKKFLELATSFNLPKGGAAREWKDAVEKIKDDIKVQLSRSGGYPEICAVFKELAQKEVEYLSRPKKERAQYGGNDKERALTYPIENLVKVNGMGFAFCPFHKEKTPSMKVYQDNHAFCFGCSTRADSISLAMHKYGITFKEAIKKLNGEDV